MKSVTLKSFDEVQQEIENYESQISRNALNGKFKGIVYTPESICNYISEKCIEFLAKESNIESIRILDPACGTGRFLISMALNLYKFIKLKHPNEDNSEIKKKIVKNNLFGIDLDGKAIDLCRLRLAKWASIDTESLNANIVREDFLLGDVFAGAVKFDIVLGNPPYIENKKMKSVENKQILKKKYNTAYKLYDISILFIERAYQLLKNEGICSYIITNKFLSADYGLKIRDLLINQTKILEITDISSLNVFKKAATYPIIMIFEKSENYERSNHLITIKTPGENEKFEDLSLNKMANKEIAQVSIKSIPSFVIPIRGDFEIIDYLLRNFKPLYTVFPTSKFVYRPFSFTNWARFLDLTTDIRKSTRDLLLIGTSNIGRYHFKLNKDIRIAKRCFKPKFFPYDQEFDKIWENVERPKLVFKEVAKHLTAVYDPGKVINVTGAYMFTGEGLSEDILLALSVIFNSTCVNYLFTSLFGSLHMASGYLRYNGSFLRRIPIPEKIPKILSVVGRILHFLHQNKNIQKKDNFETLIEFFERFANAIINVLYFTDILAYNKIYFENLSNILDNETHNFTEGDVSINLAQIKSFNEALTSSKGLREEIDSINNFKWMKEFN